MWSDVIGRLQTSAVIEFGMHQIERNSNGRLWRRHNNRSRFENLSNALFSDKGAYAACTGVSPYPKRQYSATGRLVVPYAAAWVQGEGIAILVRASVPFPEVVLVDSESIEHFSPADDAEALVFLATLFGQGARANGLKWLTETEIIDPVNLR